MNGYESHVKKILTENGWCFAQSGKGSHEIWGKSGAGKLVTVPQNCKSRDLANAIMKQAGIKHKFN